MDFTTITGAGPVTMGTPTTLTNVTANALTATSHTHAITGFVSSVGFDDGVGFTRSGSPITGIGSFVFAQDFSEFLDITESTGIKFVVTDPVEKEIAIADVDLSDFNNDLTLFTNPLIFTQTANQTIAATTDKTALTGSGNGSIQIGADALTVGDVIRVEMHGTYTNTSGGPINLTFTVDMNAVSFASATGSIITGTAAWDWTLEFDITVRSTGAGGTGIIGGDARLEHRSSSFYIIIPLTSTSTSTLNTTITQDVNIAVQWASADINAGITSVTGTIELLQSP